MAEQDNSNGVSDSSSDRTRIGAGAVSSVSPTADSTPPPSKCQMCGNPSARLEAHHAVPRIYGGEDRDLIDVCPKCHTTADQRFKNFIYNPLGLRPSYSNLSKERKYRRNIQKRKMLYVYRCDTGGDEKRAGVQVGMVCNVNTGTVTVYYGRFLGYPPCYSPQFTKSIFHKELEPRIAVHAALSYSKFSGKIAVRVSCYSKDNPRYKRVIS